MRVVFLHPDLGIGGAERLVVDAAVAVRSCHQVVVYTTHHHPHHCFPETRDGGSYTAPLKVYRPLKGIPPPGTLKVVCVGDWLPRSVLGKGAALCAYLRMLLLGLYVVLRVPFDVAIVDQVSVCVPLLRAFCRGGWTGGPC
ncbi:hypothetical protein HAZT_HAZT007228 [Hyalella azteca]|uniref:Glycosyltransferase subfamily 4-like N-terminal domain-containing protein n=1 Tax=Hyalella azteca TaxID=294128 RepID=A0A6A0HFB9_HYAAZ|nr:hypothetical protein HAZT_HAZT007228 [Hyalella azteca]